MDDILRRLGALETDVSGIKADVSGIKAEIAGINARLPYLAAKSDVSEVKTSIIQWIVSTTIAAAAVAFAIAKFVH
jgi:hypothetical protein